MNYSFLNLLILLPTLLLKLIISIRNFLYDKNIKKSTSPEVFTINVGNLNLGGTGKTPHVEYLVRLLSKKYKISILSRGYKRKTKGFVLAQNPTNANQIGDEPTQYFLKFSPNVHVAVCEKRIEGVREIQRLFTDNEIVILDDAFQHRAIKSHLNILLCDFNRPFFDDYLFPLGKLRDERKSANRADAIIVTKCPHQLNDVRKAYFTTQLYQIIPKEVPIYFSSISYKNFCSYTYTSDCDVSKPVIVVTGIAKPEVFVEYLEKNGLLIKQIQDYPDHYNFQRKDVEKIIFGSGDFRLVPQIITTEKDFVKLKPLLSPEEQKHFYFVPIEIEIAPSEEFETFVLNKINRYVGK